MPNQVHEFYGIRVFECAGVGPILRTGQDAIDLISEASKDKVKLFAIPISRLSEDFFRLETRIAGDFLQKFVTYGFRVAIVGDISHQLSDRRALCSFVSESNRGRQIWFVATLDQLRARMETVSSA
jgi:Domain of unknown function (DUF4180)